MKEEEITFSITNEACRKKFILMEAFSPQEN